MSKLSVFDDQPPLSCWQPVGYEQTLARCAARDARDAKKAETQALGQAGMESMWAFQDYMRENGKEPLCSRCIRTSSPTNDVKKEYDDYVSPPSAQNEAANNTCTSRRNDF